jgi:GDP-L-fucose synthase
VAMVTGFEGETEWDTSKPNGTPQKLLDVSKLRSSGWTASIGFERGLRSTVDWYRTHLNDLRGT